MQKKVMAVAVATALAAPAVALAQGSSVQIYGAISMSGEDAQAKGADTNSVLTPLTQGNGSSIRGGNVGGGYVSAANAGLSPGIPSAENVNEPGRTRTQGAGSNVGVRGREDLGNGLYMGFQAELAMQQGGITPQGGVSGGVTATWRNSGLWLGGRWGEVRARRVGFAVHRQHQHARRGACTVRQRVDDVRGRPARRRYVGCCGDCLWPGPGSVVRLELRADARRRPSIR